MSICHVQLHVYLIRLKATSTYSKSWLYHVSSIVLIVNSMLVVQLLQQLQTLKIHKEKKNI